MIAILTGDIINSREGKAQDWLKFLKKVLSQYGEQNKDWEIFRGDSFQLLVPAEKAIIASLHIKAAVKTTSIQDVRIGIGLGKQSHRANTIKESNGTAFVNSGESFESLKKQTLAVKSGYLDWDDTLNLILILAMLTADAWSSAVAHTICTSLEHPEKNQKQIAQLLDKSQSSISEALNRGGYHEMVKMDTHYKKILLHL